MSAKKQLQNHPVTYTFYVKFLGLEANFSKVYQYIWEFARQWSREKFAISTLKPRSHVRILIYPTWAIMQTFKGNMLC